MNRWRDQWQESAKMKRPRGLVGLLALCAFTSLCLAPVVPTLAESISGSADESRENVSLQSVLDPQLSDHEQEAQKVIKSTFMNAQSRGGWDPSVGHGISYLPASKLLLQALHNNLTIQMGRLDVAMVKQAVEEAEAVFAPLFQVNLSHSGSMVYERQQTGSVMLKDFQPKPGGNTYMAIPTNSNKYQVDRIGYLQLDETAINELYPDNTPQGKAGWLIDKTYPVSSEQDAGWLSTESGSLSIQQQLPWGPSISLVKNSSYKETYYDGKRKKSWDAPWAISVSASLNSPVPYGKNYGPHSSFNTTLEQAKIADKKVSWTLKTIINNTLLQAILAYWDLVKTQENLLVAIENHRYLQKQMGHAWHLFDKSRMTKYGMRQMEMEVARAEAQEAEARQSLLTASAMLMSWINKEQVRVEVPLFLPVGYQAWLEQEKTVDSELVLTTALVQRPELQAKDLDLLSVVLSEKFRQNQTRPNLNFGLSGTLSQSNAVYGYKNYWDSLSSITEPDSHSIASSLSYTHPWKNRAAKAALVQSQNATQSMKLSRRFLEQTIRKEVSDALVSLASSRARVASARSNKKLAVLALEKARKRWKAVGDIGEMELLKQSRKVLNARYAHVAAMVDHKKAEYNLASAQGMIAEGLSVDVAVNVFDRQRLKRLNASGEMHYFTSSRVDQKSDSPVN